MPLLTITSTKGVDPAVKEPFFERLAAAYAEIMESETSFVTVKFRHLPREDLWLGRATPESDIVVLEADIRAGRPPEQRRTFAVEFIGGRGEYSEA